jgi:type I restriction enzyme S subunit
MEAPLGHVALVDREDIALAQRIVRFRLNPFCLDCEFVLLAMNSAYFQHQLLVRATGSTAHGIKASKLPQLVIVYPPLKEQRRIVSWLADELKPLRAAVLRTECEIALIHEYRTRLMADVVTGKLDVRHFVARTTTPSPVDLEPLDNGEVIEDQPEDEDLEAVEEVADAD